MQSLTRFSSPPLNSRVVDKYGEVMGTAAIRVRDRFCNSLVLWAQCHPSFFHVCERSKDLVHFEGLAWYGITLEARSSLIKDPGPSFAQLLELFELLQVL
jgi:hypothetical protein